MVNLGNEIPQYRRIWFSILPTKDQVNALDTVGFLTFFHATPAEKKKKKKRLNIGHAFNWNKK